MIQLNVASVVELTKRFLPGMVQQGRGRILNVASTAAFVPGPWMSVYFATKAFVLSFSEAIEYELSGVTVTALCPGPTESEFKVRAGSERSRLFETFLMDAPTVARAGYDGMMKGKSVVIPGLRNKLIPIATRLIPRPMMARLSHRAARPSAQ
jgi:short-subunit dehydrogenase